MFRRLGLLLPLVLLLLAGCASMPTTPDPARGHFVQRELEFEGRQYRYSVFVPADAQPRPWPVVLFLHGSGERGDDGHAPVKAGLGPYVRRQARAFPALAVFPQVPDGESWSGTNARMALAVLDAADAEFGGDPARTYLTGISMGGFGVWEVALQAPARFAALVPVCGAVRPLRDEHETLSVEPVATDPHPYTALATRLAHVPAWIFHGAQDDSVPPTDDRRLYHAARRVGADFRYSEYAEGGHDVWDATYADPALWEWLFAHHLS